MQAKTCSWTCLRLFKWACVTFLNQKYLQCPFQERKFNAKNWTRKKYDLKLWVSGAVKEAKFSMQNSASFLQWNVVYFYLLKGRFLRDEITHLSNWNEEKNYLQ